MISIVIYQANISISIAKIDSTKVSSLDFCKHCLKLSYSCDSEGSSI